MVAVDLIVAGALLLPALLVATWMRVWFVHRSRRWLYYFPAGLAAVLIYVSRLRLPDPTDDHPV
jgi:hypothetical protein